MQAASSRILTSRSSNCSITSSQMVLPERQKFELVYRLLMTNMDLSY